MIQAVQGDCPSTVLLENGTLSVLVRPQEGGRIQSLRCLRSGVEFLTQISAHATFGDPSLHAAFQEGYCAGIEECLPTVGPSAADTEGGPAPDHGDFWQLPWHVHPAATATQVSLSAEGFSRPFRFEKTLSLVESTLRVKYVVENLANRSLRFLYACHPLFAVEAGDLVVLPQQVDSLWLDYSRDGRLGKEGEKIRWPAPERQPGTDLRRVGPATDATAEMFYTDALQSGRCGLYRSAQRQGLVLDFDTDSLPYLGVWLCYGGWPDEGGPLQYAVALEPTVAPRNTLRQACREGLAPVLESGAVYSWTIDFQISEAGMSEAAFSELCGPSISDRRRLHVVQSLCSRKKV